MEDINQKIQSQQEVIRDLQTRLSQATNEDEKKSIQLKLNVAQAKLEQYQNEQNTENVSEDVDIKNEDAPYQKTHFLDTDNDGYPIFDEKKDKCVCEEVTLPYNVWYKKVNNPAGPVGSFKNNKDAEDFIDRYIKAFNGADGDKNNYIIKYQPKGYSIEEGCMTKKFENMSNKDIANYIFRHPHTKFADKMKECDSKEIMKAFRSLKADEDAPVTNTSAVATADMPLMYTKRKLNESVDSEISEILDDVEDAYGVKGKKMLKDAIYHNKWDMTPNSFLNCANKLADKGYLDDFILSIIENDSAEYQRLIKKC